MSRLMKKIVRRNTAPTGVRPPGLPSTSTSASGPGATRRPVSGSSSPDQLKEHIAKEINTFCIQAQWDREDEHYVRLPTIVDCAEGSPDAARHAARVLRRILQSYLDSVSKPTTATMTTTTTVTENQAYNAINLTRILATHPGPVFTVGIDDKFVAIIKKLLRDGRSSSLQQVLMEVLTWMEQERATDRNLKGLLQVWAKEKKVVNKRLKKATPAPSPNYSTHPSNTTENVQPHHRDMFPIYSAQTIPPPDELAERICEAQNSALILSQVIEQTPASQFPHEKLLPEFSARCQAASDSLQSYMNAAEPPDERTMLSLIEITEELAVALSRYRRAALVARRINSVPVDEVDENEVGRENEIANGSGGSSRNSASANARAESGTGGAGSSTISPSQACHEVFGSPSSMGGASVPTQSISSVGIATTAPPVPKDYRDRQPHQYSAPLPGAKVSLPIHTKLGAVESTTPLPGPAFATSGVETASTPSSDIYTPSSMYVNLHQNTSYGMLPTLSTTSARQAVPTPAPAPPPARAAEPSRAAFPQERLRSANSAQDRPERKLEWYYEQYSDHEAGRASNITPGAAFATTAELFPPSSPYPTNENRFAQDDTATGGGTATLGKNVNVNVGADMSSDMATRLLDIHKQRSGVVFGQDTANVEVETGANWYDPEPRHSNPFVDDQGQAFTTSQPATRVNGYSSSLPMHESVSTTQPPQATHSNQWQSMPASGNGAFARQAAPDSLRPSRHGLPSVAGYDAQDSGAYPDWNSQHPQTTCQPPFHRQAYADDDSDRELYDDVEYEGRRPRLPQSNMSVFDRMRNTAAFPSPSWYEKRN